MRWTRTLWALPLIVAACGPSAEERDAAADEAQMQAQADSVSMAEAAYDESVFDTLTWESDQEALDRGLVVWRFSCRKCHGEEGAGDGGFVVEGDTLQPPSFLTAEWPYAQDVNALRAQIFRGNTEGMPHWGLVGLKYRDMDAVSRYIIEVMRGQSRTMGD